MNTKLMFAVVLAFTSSQTVAETIAVSALSPKEQIHHRLLWCEQAQLEFSLPRLEDVDVPTYNKAVRTKNGIITAVKLLRSTYNLPRMAHFDPKYFDSFERKIKDDFDAAILLEKLEITQSILEECNKDLVLLVEDDYVPNFSYLGD